MILRKIEQWNYIVMTYILGKIFDEISIWINVARYDNFPRENFSFQSFISRFRYLHINNKYLKYHKTIQNVFQSTLAVTLINVVYGAIFIYIISYHYIEKLPFRFLYIFQFHNIYQHLVYVKLSYVLSNPHELFWPKLHITLYRIAGRYPIQ